MTAYTYGSPFDSAAPGSTVSSTFPDELGSTASADSGSKVFNAYT